MGKLRFYLPPFAPDYSGVCAALFELGGLVVIHDAGGCTGNYTGYDEPRWYGSRSAVFCSGLREMDAVLGTDQLLINKVISACTDISPAFVALLGSPVPMLIGIDMPGIAAELQERLGLPCFGLDTNGLRLYNKGIAMAELAIAERFIREPRQTKARSLNILGLTPLDFSLNANATQLPHLLKSWGYSLIAPFDMGNTLEQTAQAGEAQVNLVVSQAGLALAQYLESRYHIPYVAGLPMGSPGAQVLRIALQQTMQDGISRIIGKNSSGQRILFIGEQLQGNAWRAAYAQKTGRTDVCIACLYGCDEQLAAPGDLDVQEEEQIMQLLNSGQHEIIITDPLLQPCIKAAHTVQFHAFPHIGLSSKLYWDAVPVFYSTAMDELLECCGS